LQLIKLHLSKNNTNICDFLRFQNLEKWTNLRLPVNVQKLKMFQLQGAPWRPDHGLCPWTPLGLRSQTAVIGSRTALAVGPCPQKNFRLEPPLPEPSWGSLQRSLEPSTWIWGKSGEGKRGGKQSRGRKGGKTNCWRRLCCERPACLLVPCCC